MLLSSSLECAPSQLENLAKSTSNRIRNGLFEDSDISFFPWIPSGFVQLKAEGETAFVGSGHVRFTPGSGQIGRIWQRTRNLRLGKLYVLRFAIRSSGDAPRRLVLQFGCRTIVISGRDLPSDYNQFTFVFRARARHPRVRFTVFGNTGSIVDLDAVSLCSNGS
ncbi:hypothetical protein ACFO25_16530 [Paenactinomyces guangxiensis]|uniref:Uncharacterized protein n=1 Tax=Paenactinomyces guangxiensis TaxID=1490290 RepID=A0A7W1WU29_9BACL|nr:hypothetical protein [Paenactinomyces guangxiensis]MBA4496080.1 hypothetical protein [Paenactinomyces guangxiensis]MBH8593168.1 hypothetical protein [Paenactinomyces guangxiensis]